MHTVYSLQLCIRRGIVGDLNVCPFFNVRDQVSHPCQTTGKIMVMYILIFILAEILPLTNGDPIMKLNVPLGLSMKLHLPLSLSLLQYIFMWMKLYISLGLL